MNHDSLGLIRMTLLLAILLSMIGCCVIEAAPTDEPTITEPTIVAEKEPPIMLCCTEPPTIATDPATEPTETEPIETEPVETWESLGIYELTAYCPCSACCGSHGENRPTDENGNPIVYTSIGAVAKAGTTIAVDPSVIPYGSEIQIYGHTYIAQDTGGAINGNRIDIYFEDHQEALVFGRQWTEIFIKTTSA